MKLTRWVACSLLVSCVARADHLPKSKMALGKADSVLGGIDIYKTTVAQIIARWGKPDEVRNSPDQGSVAGSRDYIWRRGDDEIDCGTWNDKGLSSVVYSVEVRGIKSNKELSTARGLYIGASAAVIRQLYGARYVVGAKEPDEHRFTIQWADETTLYVDVDRSNRVVAIHLLAATE